LQRTSEDVEAHLVTCGLAKPPRGCGNTLKHRSLQMVTYVEAQLTQTLALVVVSIMVDTLLACIVWFLGNHVTGVWFLGNLWCTRGYLEVCHQGPVFIQLTETEQ
jgi:ABC-type arginine/histidine transport system permease subunit